MRRQRSRGEHPGPPAFGSRYRLPGAGTLCDPNRSHRPRRLELPSRWSQQRFPEHPKIPRKAERAAQKEEAPEEALDSRSATLGSVWSGRSRRVGVCLDGFRERHEAFEDGVVATDHRWRWPREDFLGDWAVAEDPPNAAGRIHKMFALHQAHVLEPFVPETAASWLRASEDDRTLPRSWGPMVSWAWKGNRVHGIGGIARNGGVGQNEDDNVPDLDVPRFGVVEPRVWMDHVFFGIPTLRQLVTGVVVDLVVVLVFLEEVLRGRQREVADEVHVVSHELMVGGALRLDLLDGPTCFEEELGKPCHQQKGDLFPSPHPKCRSVHSIMPDTGGDDEGGLNRCRRSSRVL